MLCNVGRSNFYGYDNGCGRGDDYKNDKDNDKGVIKEVV